jgi:hypothetical protein
VRATEDPTKKQTSTEPFFFGCPKCLVGKMDFVSTRIGWVVGWGTSLGRTLFSVQGHRSGSGEVPGISDLPGDRGPCKKNQLRPNFFSSADPNVWSGKWISFLRESGWVAGWGTSLGRTFIFCAGTSVRIRGGPRDLGPPPGDRARNGEYLLYTRIHRPATLSRRSYTIAPRRSCEEMGTLLCIR